MPIGLRDCWLCALQLERRRPNHAGTYLDLDIYVEIRGSDYGVLVPAAITLLRRARPAIAVAICPFTTDASASDGVEPAFDGQGLPDPTPDRAEYSPLPQFYIRRRRTWWQRPRRWHRSQGTLPPLPCRYDQPLTKPSQNGQLQVRFAATDHEEAEGGCGIVAT